MKPKSFAITDYENGSCGSVMTTSGAEKELCSTILNINLIFG
jgi:hypothetical protein